MARELADTKAEDPPKGARRRSTRGKRVKRIALVVPLEPVGGSASEPRRTLTAAEKRQTALDLKLQGYSHQAIANALDLSPERVSELLKEILRDTLALTAASAEELRMLELERLDRMLIEQWPFRMGKAADTILKILERRSKLLGLDAPTKSEITNHDSIGVSVSNLDLSKLSDEELGWLEIIVTKAAPALPAPPALPHQDFLALGAPCPT